MDKPTSLSVKAWIIRNMSVKMMLQETTIETVVNHQFESALSAMETNDSIEFSGFGKIFFNRKKALKKLLKYESQLLTFDNLIADEATSDIRRRNLILKRESVEKNHKYLKSRVNENI